MSYQKSFFFIYCELYRQVPKDYNLHIRNALRSDQNSATNLYVDGQLIKPGTLVLSNPKTPQNTMEER